MAAVLFAWHRSPAVSSLPPEHVFSAIRVGLRYVASAPELRAVLLRLATYVLGYSVIPALLAVVARSRFHMGAAAFGLLLGCLGVGGVIGASLLPRLRRSSGPDVIATACLLVAAAAVGALAAAQSPAFAYPVMVALGFASIGTISSFMIAAQTVLPDWVRGRGVAVLGLVFQAGFAVGAAVWGAIAVRAGVTEALAAAATLIAVGSVLGLRIRLAGAEGLDGRAAHAPFPYPPVSVAADDGPVQLSVEYTVSSDDLAAFRSAAAQLRGARTRSGAMHWGLYSDVHEPTRQVEVFTVPSWAEHLRQAARETNADRVLAERVSALHQGPGPPIQRALVNHHHALRRHRLGRDRRPATAAASKR